MRVLITGEADAGIERTLQRRGHVVTHAQSAKAAWGAYREEVPKLVILAEGGEAGLSLCRRLRRGLDGAGPWILALLPAGSPERLDALLEAGADDVLVAPFDAETFDVLPWRSIVPPVKRPRRRRRGSRSVANAW